jgi:hypothetical protein
MRAVTGLVGLQRHLVCSTSCRARAPRSEMRASAALHRGTRLQYHEPADEFDLPTNIPSRVSLLGSAGDSGRLTRTRQEFVEQDRLAQTERMNRRTELNQVVGGSQERLTQGSVSAQPQQQRWVVNMRGCTEVTVRRVRLHHSVLTHTHAHTHTHTHIHTHIHTHSLTSANVQVCSYSAF